MKDRVDILTWSPGYIDTKINTSKAGLFVPLPLDVC